MNEQKLGDRATCKMCSGEIEYIGPYWRHVGEHQPRHPATPKPIIELEDYTPSEFWKIEAFTNGYQIVVMGSPPDSEDLGIPDDDLLNHNCDDMGCGSVGDHVLCRIPVMQPMPELNWTNENWRPSRPHN